MIGFVLGFLGRRLHANDLAEFAEEHVRVGALSRTVEFPLGDEGLDGGGEGGGHWGGKV